MQDMCGIVENDEYNEGDYHLVCHITQGKSHTKLPKYYIVDDLLPCISQIEKILPIEADRLVTLLYTLTCTIVC